MSRLRRLGIAFVLLAITHYGGDLYRGWAYGNGIIDFGLADAWTNIWGVPSIVFFGLAFVGDLRVIRIPASVIGGTLGLIAYEFLQPYLVHGTFDWADVKGTLLGGLIALQLYALFEKGQTPNAGASQ